MRKTSIAIVSIAAALGLTMGNQHSHKSLVQTANSCDASALSSLSSQVEEHFLSEIKEYFHGNPSDNVNAEVEQTDTSNFPPNV
jgi:hypothetical protein